MASRRWGLRVTDMWLFREERVDLRTLGISALGEGEGLIWVCFLGGKGAWYRLN